MWITATAEPAGVVLRSNSGGALRVAVIFSLLIAALASVVPPVAHAQTDSEFAVMCDALTALDGRDSIRLGIVVHDLESGERCEIRANESFRSASLYKLIILAEAQRQAALGLFSFDELLLIEPRHAIDDPPELRPAFTIERTTGEAIRRMIQSSANADALALRERLGIDETDALPSAIGMESTRLGEEFVTTPDDIATYFAALYRGDLVNEEASASMLELLRGQLLRELIPEPLPANTPIAHKTGTLNGYLHDAGIVFAPSGSYVLVAMSQHPLTQVAATEMLREVSAVAFQPYAFAAGTQPLLSEEFQATEVEPAIAAGVIAGFEAGRAASASEPDVPPTDRGASPIAAGPAAELVESPSNSGFSLPGISGVGLREGAVGAITLSVFAALLGVFSYGSRLRRSRERDYNLEAVNAVAGEGERRALMRLGIRKSDSNEMAVEETAVVPASDSIAEIEAQPIMPSPRLERMAEFFDSQQHLLESIHEQYEDEVRPLNALLARQSLTQRRLLTNLEARLRPLNEYAAGEESNLDALEQRMSEQGPDFIQRSFSEYLSTQRQRIADTRDQIDEQRLPLLAYGEEQRDAVEVALSRFDAEIEALELNIAERRKLLMRMLDAMRSDSFVAVKRFLESREAAMGELAEANITDPGQIGQSVQNLRDAVDAMASQSVHIQSVLEATDLSDERLVESAPGGGPYPLPTPVMAGSFDDALAELEAAETEAGDGVAGA